MSIYPTILLVISPGGHYARYESLLCTHRMHVPNVRVPSYIVELLRTQPRSWFPALKEVQDESLPLSPHRK